MDSVFSDILTKRVNIFSRVTYMVLCILVAGSLNLFSQTQNSRFEHLTVAEGLSGNRIWSILRDNKDYLWIATDIGLDRYDCSQVVKYRYDENIPGSISSNNARCIYEDSKKNLWVGTTEGLNLYDRSRDNFKVLKNFPDDTSSLNGNSISSILEDRKGNLWVVTDGNCINKYNPENQTFIRFVFKDDEQGLNIRPVKMAAEDTKGNIWIACFNQAILRFDPDSGEFSEFTDPGVDMGSNCLKSLYIDKNDKIWIVTDGNGFFSYNPALNKFEKFASNGNRTGTNGNRILDIIPEDEDHLLLAVDQGGINRFDKKNKTFEYIRHDEANISGLNYDGIWCLFKDIEGILWVGTSGGGVNYYNPKKDNFKIFTHNINDPESLSHDIILCFLEDYEGMIWIGTDGGGLNIYNPATGKFRTFKHNPSDPYSISGNIVSCLVEDKNHDIWLGTWDAEFDRYERRTGRFYHYPPKANDPSSLSGRTIWSMIKDVDGKICLGGFQTGLDLFDIDKGVIKRFKTDPNNPESLSNAVIRFMYKDADNNIWITTSNGLNLLNKNAGTFIIFNFPDNDIEAVLKDKGGNLWAGSHASGLYHFNIDGSVIKTYTTSDGLPSNSLRALLEDDNGMIWISTTSGLSCFDYEKEYFKNYSMSDGLQGDEFIRQSFMKTRDGKLYFGGYNGFNSFYPERLKDNDLIPPVYISDFQIFNKPVIYGDEPGQFPVHISEAREIELTWQESVFSFTFNAINYTSPDKNRYAYFMEGFEKDWNYIDASRRYVTYTNLDPGEYTFRVKASNNDGIWNTQGAALKITILPPWWGTWWFRISASLAIILITLSIFMSRVLQLKKQKILLEKTVTYKTAELHEMNVTKDKFFSIIAHDLKNPFNTLIGFSEVLKESIDSNDTEMIKDSANIINKTTIQTYNLLENLLEWSKSQSGKILFRPETLNLKDLCDEEFNVLNEMAKSKNIELKCNFTHDMVIKADKYMIRTVLRNLVSNAIKFTRKGGMVDVKGIVDNNHFEISVSDSGIGMSDEIIKKLFNIDSDLVTVGTENEKGTGLGLILCKEFVEKHGGRIWAESLPGKSSTFIFTVPFNVNQSG